MRHVFGGRAGMALAFVLGLVIAAGGTAAAGGLITGRQIKNGSIQAKDLSRGLRARIAHAGPIGPQGPAGPAGASGIGPAFRVVATPKGGGGAFLSSTLPSPAVATLDLPAGSYVLSGTMQFGPDAATTAYAALCDLTAGADSEQGRVVAQKDGNIAQVSVGLLHTFATAGTVTLACGDALTTPAFWTQASITAIRVSTVTTTTQQIG